ncbi:uncharacterized protein V6R79_006027 [Siganus canaliculatus]
MNTFLWSFAALATLFVTVETLTCNTCDVSFLGLCIGDKEVNCTASQDRCYSAVATFSSDLIIPVYDRGCIALEDCVNETVPLLSISYTITRSCCSTNLCNGASSIQLPLTAALAAALLGIWSQWIL